MTEVGIWDALALCVFFVCVTIIAVVKIRRDH